MNEPYVKKYNKQGELINPIRGMYVNQEPNRSERRAHMYGVSTPYGKGRKPNSTKLGSGESRVVIANGIAHNYRTNKFL